MNNKIYFTKYISVEGEIKEGDWYRSRKYPHLEAKKATAYWNKEIMSFYDIERVRLFLCSRDITFPCDIYCFGEKVWRKNCQSMSCDECVRVIGEVSPDATWVTENMEFEEHNLPPLV